MGISIQVCTVTSVTVYENEAKETEFFILILLVLHRKYNPLLVSGPKLSGSLFFLQPYDAQWKFWKADPR